MARLVVGDFSVKCTQLGTSRLLGTGRGVDGGVGFAEASATKNAARERSDERLRGGEGGQRLREGARFDVGPRRTCERKTEPRMADLVGEGRLRLANERRRCAKCQQFHKCSGKGRDACMLVKGVPHCRFGEAGAGVRGEVAEVEIPPFRGPTVTVADRRRLRTTIDIERAPLHAGVMATVKAASEGVAKADVGIGAICIVVTGVVGGSAGKSRGRVASATGGELNERAFGDGSGGRERRALAVVSAAGGDAGAGAPFRAMAGAAGVAVAVGGTTMPATFAAFDGERGASFATYAVPGPAAGAHKADLRPGWRLGGGALGGADHERRRDERRRRWGRT